MSTPVSPSRSSEWMRRTRGCAVFCWCFVRELVMANIAVAKTVLLQSNAELAPGFVTYSIEGLSRFEVFLLTHCITLTPGTTSVEVSEDFKTVVVHALDARDLQGVRDSIKNGLEKPILAWTR